MHLLAGVGKPLDAAAHLFSGVGKPLDAAAHLFAGAAKPFDAAAHLLAGAAKPLTAAPLLLRGATNLLAGAGKPLDAGALERLSDAVAEAVRLQFTMLDADDAASQPGAVDEILHAAQSKAQLPAALASVEEAGAAAVGEGTMKAHGRAAAAQLREAICAAYARHAFSRQLDLVQARVSTGRAQLRAAAVTPASVQAQRAAMGATHPWLGSMLKKAAFVEAAAMPNLKDKPNKGQGKAQPAAHKVGEEPEHVKMQMALASVADAVHDFEVELQAMRALLRKPADCGEALVSAAMLGHAAAAEHALQLGARPDATVNGPTALTWAAQRGDLDMVRLLLRARANPNVCGYRGFTPLLYATLHGYRDVARALEAAGADADLARTQLKKALKRTPVVKAPANDDAAHSWSLADGMAALVAAVGPV